LLSLLSGSRYKLNQTTTTIFLLLPLLKLVKCSVKLCYISIQVNLLHNFVLPFIKRILKQTLLILLFIAFGFSGLAQVDEEEVDPMLINFKAQVISASDSSVVPYANIINNRTHGGTITNIDGYFSLEMLNIDSLIITSIGFEKSTLKVPRNYSEYETFTFLLKPVNYAIGEIEVTGEKQRVDLGLGTGKPTDISPELRGDAFNEAPPILAAFFNPISYWQYYLSKKEKRKRNVRDAQALEKNWELHSLNYNKEKVMMLTGLKETEADTFMIWFNGQNVLPFTSTEYQIRASIIEYYHYYQLEKAMKK
jgi:hypothetical protein